MDSSDVVLFIAPADDGGWRQVELRPALATARNGSWMMRTSGHCELQPVMPADRSLALLWLDPARLPTPTGRTLRLLLVENACASGQSPAGRIGSPVVVYRPDAVFILITVTRRPGAQDCQGNPEYPYDLTLAEALGSRPLRNAGVLPPAEMLPWATVP